MVYWRTDCFALRKGVDFVCKSLRRVETGSAAGTPNYSDISFLSGRWTITEFTKPGGDHFFIWLHSVNLREKGA